MKKVRVLVVDDSALMRKLIPQMLAADEALDVRAPAHLIEALNVQDREPDLRAVWRHAR